MFSRHIDLSYEFFAGEGQVSSCFSAIDWENSALGHFSKWPLSLKSTIRLLLDSPTPYYLVWGEKKIQFYNEACFHLFGGDKTKHCLGQSALIKGHALWPAIAVSFDKIVSGQSKSFSELEYSSNHSSRKPLTLSLSPVRDDDGQRNGVLVLLKEKAIHVREDEHLSAERERFRIIADRLPAFISYVGTDKKYKFINGTYSEWMGQPRSSIEGRLREDVAKDHPTFEFMEPYHKRALTGERVRFELFFSRPDGDHVVLDTEYLPDVDPVTKKVRGIISVGQNITERRKALIEAEKAQKELREIFMQTPLPMAIMTGPDLVFTMANPYYLKFAGRDVLNKPLLEAFTFSEVEKFLPSIQQVYHEGRPVLMAETSLKVTNRKGVEKELILNAEYHPFKDSMGITIGVMLILHNVTDQVMARRRVEESQERYRQLADTIPQLMWTATPNGKIDYANKRCAQYCGFNSQDRFGMNWLRMVHPDDLQPVFRAWKTSMTTGKPFIEEYRIKRADGTFRWFLAKALAIRNQNNEILYWNGTATDIEEHKKIEAELETARSIAEKANKTKSAFLANMSHEIRTPLSAILGYSELLKNSDIPKDLRDQYFETINRNGKALGKIIDDILDLAKVEAGKIDIEYVDFNFHELLNEVIDLMSQKAETKEIVLQLNIQKDVPRVLNSDPARLRQIVLNIIGNAVKFTEKGSVVVNVKSTKESNEALKIYIEVEDTGRGLDDEQKEKIFRPFSQADNTTTRQYGGTGLGLALSKRLSEALGGTITVERYRKNEGCTFVISFIARPGLEKINVKEEEKETFACKGQQTLNGVNILFADDSEDNQFLVEHFLSIHGASVSLASDGVEAVEKAINGNFDIVLMDIQMPRMDGYQAAKLLFNQGYKIPIVALTAHAMEEERERSRSLGFCSHLTKPFNFNELLKTVAHHGSRKL